MESHEALIYCLCDNHLKLEDKCYYSYAKDKFFITRLYSRSVYDGSGNAHWIAWDSGQPELQSESAYPFHTGKIFTINKSEK